MVPSNPSAIPAPRIPIQLDVAPESESEESDDESEESESSESESEASEEQAAGPSMQGFLDVEAEESGSASSDSSDSDEEDEDEDEEDSSESDSDETSSSEEDIETPSLAYLPDVGVKRKMPQKPLPPTAVPLPSSDSEPDPAPPPKRVKFSTSTPDLHHLAQPNGHAPASSSSVAAPAMPNGGGRGQNKRFERIKSDGVTYLHDGLRDNSFDARVSHRHLYASRLTLLSGMLWTLGRQIVKAGADRQMRLGVNANDYGVRAERDLQLTRGAGFRKEKNKKKRGSYAGGEITLESHSIKFDD